MRLYTLVRKAWEKQIKEKRVLNKYKNKKKLELMTEKSGGKRRADVDKKAKA